MNASIQCRLGLLIGAALAAMAFAAPAAIGATQVKDAGTGELCPEVSPALDPETSEEELLLLVEPSEYVSGGCTVHMSWLFKEGEPPDDPRTEMYFEGSVYDQCYITYDIHVGPSGWGYADNFQFKASSACNSYGHSTWQGGLYWNMPIESQVIAPKESNPEGIFPLVDGNTDLNAVLGAHAVHMGSPFGGQGAVSLDVTQSDPLVIDNQSDYGDPDTGFFGDPSFRGGAWEGDAGLIVTH